MANLVAMESHLNKTKLDYTCKCFLGCITEQNLLHKNCCCILAVYYRFTLAAFNMQTQVKERASFKLSVHMHAKGLKWQIINIQFKFPFWRTIQQMWPTFKKKLFVGRVQILKCFEYSSNITFPTFTFDLRMRYSKFSYIRGGSNFSKDWMCRALIMPKMTNIFVFTKGVETGNTYVCKHW